VFAATILVLCEPAAGRTLERDGVPDVRGGMDPRLARLCAGLGEEGLAFVVATALEVGFGVGLAMGLDDGWGAETDPREEARDPDEERVASDGEDFRTGFGAGETLVCRGGTDPLEAIEGDGLETGFGALRVVAIELRGGWNERGGETRLTGGLLWRGATRLKEGA